MRNLRSTFFENVSFCAHTDAFVSKALSILGLVKRVWFNFYNVNCLETICFAHARLHLEFACIIWCPNCNNQINRIKSVQKKNYYLHNEN